jgi:carbamoyl-phosphate synthase small subunit
VGTESSPAILVLEDGTAFHGRSVGASGERAFELVFNTAMTGYQEILTDPSYAGQGVVMTYPQIGNYGVCLADDESDRCWADAMIMRQMSPMASNWRADMDLSSYLRERDVLAIDGIDTRELTLKLRELGAQRAVLSTKFFEVEALTAAARRQPSLEGMDLAARVSCMQPYAWTEGLPTDLGGYSETDGEPKANSQTTAVGISAEPTAAAAATSTKPEECAADGPHVVCMDFGVKRNILRCLVSTGFRLTVVPANMPAADILALQPNGLFLSNGPGDPAAVTYAHETVRELVQTGLPTFGICLGHQILGHVFGARTYKMKFGHHGANHPVVEDQGGRIDITSQNHGFAIDADSIQNTDLEITHRNGNDDTVSGIKHRSLPVFSVQYHPEAAPGPRDPQHLFQRFYQLIQFARCSTG